jgi:hypothetical protein
MVMGNTFSNCNGSSAFFAREAISPIKVVIWNKEPLVRLQICLLEQGHIYV